MLRGVQLACVKPHVGLSGGIRPESIGRGGKVSLRATEQLSGKKNIAIQFFLLFSTTLMNIQFTALDFPGDLRTVIFDGIRGNFPPG